MTFFFRLYLGQFLFKAVELQKQMEQKQKEMAELAEQQAREAEERAIREAEERENEMELLRQQMARDRDEENRQTEAVRNKELQEQLKVIFILILFWEKLAWEKGETLRNLISYENHTHHHLVLIINNNLMEVQEVSIVGEVHQLVRMISLTWVPR